MTRRAAGIPALIALCAAVLVPAAAFRGFTGLEFRTALIVREMLRHGPELVPHIEGAPFVDYPPLYFMAAAISSRLLGSISPFSIALPSMLAAAGTAVLVFLMAERERPGTGLAAGAALVMTPLFFVCSAQGNTDALLAFFTTLALAGCRRYSLSGARGALAAACLGLAGGALTKGPLGVAIPLLAASAWLLARRRFRACAMLLLTLAVPLAALAALFAAALFLFEGWIHLERLVGAQLLDRVGESGNHPWHYYLWVFLGGFAPWSAPALARMLRPGGRGRAEFESFCASWLLATLALLTLASTKHSRYLLPSAPPVAILAAFFLEDLRAPGAPPWALVLTRWIRRACLALLAAGAVFAAAAPLFLPVASPLLWPVVPAVCLAPLVAPALRGARGGRGSLAPLAWTMAAGFLLYAQFDLPRMTAKEEARPFVRGVESAAAGRRIVFFGVGKNADGLKFRYWRLGTAPLVFTGSPEGLRGALGNGPPPLLVVPARERGTVERELGPRLRFLFEGRLGKRRCAVYDVSPASAPSEG